MPTWPASLPQEVLAQGFAETPPETVIRSVNDQGPANTRRRYTAGVRTFTAQIPCSTAQVETFDLFFRNDIADGALSFDWHHPRTKAAASFRLTAPPRYRPIARGLRWRIDLSLEILP